MASMILNGERIELTLQKQETFGALAQTIVPMLAAKEQLLSALGAVLSHGLATPIATSEPPMQACLWLLHEMGVRAMTTSASGKGGSIDKVTTEAERACDTSDPYSAGNMATGRAMAVALSNVSLRTFLLNDMRRDVKILPRDKMAPAMQAVVDMRRLNEPIHIACTRALASLVASGVPNDDERVDAIVTLLSDLGVVGVSVDTATSTITFAGLFSEANAAASAYLQGAGGDGVQRMRARIGQLNSQAQNARAPASSVASSPASSRAATVVKPRRRR
ncbi:MAG: hypothetical protein EXS15_04735 [Phycisphaerales bacterium]|nr:hypothetical protein [Phycisphaerales bacterium]